MKKYRRETRFVSFVTVHVSSAQGLVDCLRYERMCPYSESDSHKLIKLVNSSSAVDSDHVLTLVRFSAANAPIAVERLRGFGVTLLDERSPDDVPLSDEAAMRIVMAGLES